MPGWQVIPHKVRKWGRENVERSMKRCMVRKYGGDMSSWQVIPHKVRKNGGLKPPLPPYSPEHEDGGTGMDGCTGSSEDGGVWPCSQSKAGDRVERRAAPSGVARKARRVAVAAWESWPRSRVWLDSRRTSTEARAASVRAAAILFRRDASGSVRISSHVLAAFSPWTSLTHPPRIARRTILASCGTSEYVLINSPFPSTINPILNGAHSQDRG